MRPFLFLLGGLAALFLLLAYAVPSGSSQSAGIAVLAAALAVAGSAHFVKGRAMAEMMPPGVPFPLAWVHATGLLELAAAAGLFVPRAREATGWSLILFFVAVFPANIYGALRRVPLGGHELGPRYLWFRAPLQLAFIGWTYWFAIRPAAPHHPHP